MPRTNTLTALLAVAATVLILNPALAQHCDSCNAGGGVVQGGGYAAPQYQGSYAAAPQYQGSYADLQYQGGYTSPQYQGGYVTDQFQGASFGGGECSSCDGGAGFEYPSAGGCGHGGCGRGGIGGGRISGAKANLKAWYAHIHHVNEVATARNGAWPKPFQCADRQQYFAIWQPMIQSGMNANSLLSDHHFDENGELNASGKTRLRTIAQNHPVGQKAVLIQNTGDQMVNNQRLNYVQQVVNDFYGQENFAQVAVSNSYPVKGPGARYELVNQLSAEGTAPPIIPVASGRETAQQAIGGN